MKIRSLKYVRDYGPITAAAVFFVLWAGASASLFHRPEPLQTSYSLPFEPPNSPEDMIDVPGGERLDYLTSSPVAVFTAQSAGARVFVGPAIIAQRRDVEAWRLRVRPWHEGFSLIAEAFPLKTVNGSLKLLNEERTVCRQYQPPPFRSFCN